MAVEIRKCFNTEVLLFGTKAQGLFPEGAVLEQLAEGLVFSEGPVWLAEPGCYYFTDFPEDKIYRWGEEGGMTLVTADSGRAIGLAVTADGRLLSCESRRQRIALLADGENVSVAERYRGIGFNSPNDVIASRSGIIYFTDPHSAALGLPSAQGFAGVYQVLPSGSTELVTREIKRPNGLALSRDEAILYVNDTDENVIYQFTKAEPGAAGEGSYRDKKKFAALDSGYGPGACDGMKVDRSGCVWVTGPAGIWVLDEWGEVTAILKCPEFVGNFCFGGKKGDELFITASTGIYRMKLGRIVN